MSPRYSPGSLLSLFRTSRVQAATVVAHRGSSRAVRRRAARLAAAEQLEARRMLDFNYTGVTFTSTTSALERFTYNVTLDDNGTGELWIRHNALLNRIDLADNPAFAGTYSVPPLIPAVPAIPIPGPFRLSAITSPNGFKTKAWSGEEETFFAGELRITSTSPGTKVYLANGDPFPLGLTVSLAGPASEINIRGPINTLLNKLGGNEWSTGISLRASRVTVEAEMTSGATSPIGGGVFGVGLSGGDLVELRNTITSPIIGASVTNGDLWLVAGGTIKGNTSIFVGEGTNSVGGDIRIDGSILAQSLTMQTRSSVQPTSILTGPSGIVSGGGSLTVFNAGLDGGLIDIRTKNYSVTNVNVGGPTQVNPDIGIAIDQTAGNLVIAAVPSSRGQISLKASGPDAEILINADINTQAGLALEAGVLSIKSGISTVAGNVQLTGDRVTVSSNVTAGKTGVGNVIIKSRTGAVSLTSAAVVRAPGESIVIDAKTSVSSSARLESELLDVSAGQEIALESDARQLRAQAGTGMKVSDLGDLTVRSAVTKSGPITISTKGQLDVVAATVQGAGAISLAASGGLRARDVRTKNGLIDLSTRQGDARVIGTVTAEGAAGGLRVTADQGNIIFEPKASVTVVDLVRVVAPNGRVLAPGTVTGVIMNAPGAGYTSPPIVTLQAGGGATADPVITAGGVAGIRITSGGSGYVTAPTVKLVSSDGNGANAQAQAFLDGSGSVTRIVVTNPGIGYTAAPAVVLSGGSGSGASARAQINGVSAIDLKSGGSGYLVPPQIVISSGDGAVAAPVSIDAAGGITKINLSAPGADYGVPPSVEIFDSSGAGSGAVAVATLSPGVTGINLLAPGSDYSSPPTVTISPPDGPGGRQASAEAIISGSVVPATFIIPPGAGGGGYSTGVRANVVGDGSNAAATVTISGGVSTVTLAGDTLGSGSLYATAPAVTFNPVVADPATARALLGLTSGSFTVDPGSYLYTGQVQVVFSAPTVISALSRRATGVADLGPTGSITGITITDAGAGYSAANPPSIVSFVGSFTVPPPGPGIPNPPPPPSATFNPGFFTVGAVELLTKGSGYTGDPAVVFDAPLPGGKKAAATAQIRGTITSVTITNGGSGYTSTPTLQFSDPAGGANAIAPSLALSASVIGVRVLDPGTGYTTTPSIMISGGGGTGARGSVIRSQVVAGISVKSSGANYNPLTTTVRLSPVAGGAGAVAGAVTVDSAGVVTAINLATSGRDYVAPPRVIINDTSGAGRGAEFDAVVDNDPSSPTYRQVTGFSRVSGGRGYNPETTTVTILSAGSGATAVTNVDLDPQSVGFGKISSISVLNSGSGYESGAGAPLVRIVPFGSGAEATAALSNAGGVASVSVTKGGANYAVPPKVVFSGGGGTGAVGTAIISNVATINADRLSWTAVAPPLDALASQFRALDITLTAPGDLALERASGTLVIEGARTKDGSISIKAPGLSVTGPVSAGDFSSTRTRTILLEAAADNLVIDAPVGGLLAGTTQPIPLAKTVTLRAPTGSITTTQPTPGLVTADTLLFTALDKATIETNVFTARGGTTAVGSKVTLAQRTVGTDGNVLPLSLGSAAGGLFASLGSVSVIGGDTITVYSVDAGAAGTVALAAVGAIQGVADPGIVHVVAGAASLTSDTAQIQLVTTVTELSAQTPLSTVDIDNVGSKTVTLGTINARSGVQIRSTGGLVAPSITVPNGPISLETVQPTADIVIGSLSATGFPVTVIAGGAIRQKDASIPAIKAASATFRTTDSLDLYLDAGVVTATAGNDITLRNESGMTVDLESTGGGTITLKAGGVLSQSAPIRTSGLLDVSSTGGDIVLLNPGNAVREFTARNPGRSVAYRDSGTLRIAAGGTDGIGLEATNVDLIGKTGIAQVGAIKASALLAMVTDPGAVELTSPNNAISGVTGSTVAGDFRVHNSGGLFALGGGVTAGTQSAAAGNGNIVLTALAGSLGILGDLTAISDTITLQAPTGTIIQQAGSTIRTYTPPQAPAGTLRWTAATPPTFTSVVTANVITEIGGNVSIGVPGQDVTVPETFTAAGNITIVGRNITIVGPVTTQAGRITVTSTGTVSFTPAGVFSASDVVFSAVNSSRLVLGANVPVASATLANGTLELTSRGGLRQTGPITAPILVASAGAGGAVNLTNAGNQVVVFSARAPHAGGNVLFHNAATFTVGSTGITAGTVTAGDGLVSLAALSGNLTVASNISAIADTVELRASSGLVTINPEVAVNSQNLIIIDSRGGSVRDPFQVNSAQSLASTLALINTLPAIAGTSYEIIVTADITLTQPLTVSRPVTLTGTAPGIRINGGSSANGLTFDAGASGSQVRNLVFNQFSGTAVQLSNARSVVMRDVFVLNSGTGLAMQGLSTGTSVQATTFIGNGTAISLNAVEGAAFGGTQPPNIISGSTTGVFAAGLCTGSSITGLVFDTVPATTTPFSIGSSRNLQVSGTLFQNVNPVVPDSPQQSPVGGKPTVDLNGNGVADIIWTLNTGEAVAWLDGNPNTARVLGGGGGWTLAATGDFNADGVSDLVWRSPQGYYFVWTMSPAGAPLGQGFLGGGGGWELEATGDYNGDGRTDFIWRNAGNGANVMWLMNGTASTSQTVIGGNSDWRLVSTDERFDADGNGRTDLVWRTAAAGVNVLWRMNGSSVISAQILGGDATWRIAGTGDFDGDGKSDVLWRNSNNGNVIMQLLDNGAVRSQAFIGGDTSNTVGVTMDADGDGRADIYWRNLGTGATERWLMNGTSVRSKTPFGGNNVWRLLGRPGANG